MNDYLPKATDFIAVVNAADLKDRRHYFSMIEREFLLPAPCGKGIGPHNGWLTDLSWIDARRIIFILNDFSAFLPSDGRFKRAVLYSFQEYILPFWQGNALKPIPPEKHKEFYLFCLD